MDADRILNEENVSLAQPLNSLLYFPGSNSSFKLTLIVSRNYDSQYKFWS